MSASRAGVVIALLAAGVGLAACSSTTNGVGHAAVASTAAGTSSPDFPADSPSAPTATDSPTDDSGLHPAPTQPLATHIVHTPDATYVVKVWADVQDDTCFDHAYGGPMITFLTRHPCLGLRRILATTTVNGRPVGFALSSLSFRGTTADPYVYAGQFRKLELQDGTGSVNDLLREGYRLPSGPTAVPPGEAFNVLGQDAGATVWDAWYLNRPTPSNAKALVRMTQDLFLQF